MQTTLTRVRMLAVLTVAAMPTSGALRAEQVPAPSLLERGSIHHQAAMQLCPGRGYLSYELPAVDSCPCSSEHCFHPCRYYFGGREYKGSWRSLWVRSHLGCASMLDQYPCSCQFPPLPRTYWQPLPGTPAD